MSLSASQQESLIEILDQLIPANTARGIPSGGEPGTVQYLTKAIDENRQLSDAVRMLMEHVGNQSITTELIESLESLLPEPFQLLLSETYKGYYSQGHVRGVLGLSAQPVHPQGYGVAAEPAEYLQKLTTPVKARGECYRDTKDLGGA
ncbi:MAG: hypothetical protein AAF404_19565 [Pseudomonadota bacterium]